MTRHSTKQRAQPYASRRRAALRKAKKARKIDTFLVTQPEDVGYLSGFTGADSAIVLGDGWASLVTDARYAEQAQNQCDDIEIHIRTGAMGDSLAKALKGRNVRRLGLQSDHVTLRMHELLSRSLGSRQLRPVSGVLSELRCVKDSEEIRIIRRAVRLAQRAFRELIAGGRRVLVGRTEREVAAELDYRMHGLGASAAAFETIVAAGPHSSLPHYRPGKTRIRPHQPVLFDWGAKVDGYCSDLTRTVFIGKIPHELTRVYKVVLRAQEAAIAAVARGVACKSVDAAARKVIKAAGYADQFVHGLGHGIGRMIHEAPALSARSHLRLRAGMVLTVEPGVYLPGLGGVRIEDDVLVTSQGPERLSSLNRGLSAMLLR